MNKDFYEHYSSVGVQKETDAFDLHSVKGDKCFHAIFQVFSCFFSMKERKHTSLASMPMHPNARRVLRSALPPGFRFKEFWMCMVTGNFYYFFPFFLAPSS